MLYSLDTTQFIGLIASLVLMNVCFIFKERETVSRVAGMTGIWLLVAVTITIMAGIYTNIMEATCG